MLEQISTSNQPCYEVNGDDYRLELLRVVALVKTVLFCCCYYGGGTGVCLRYTMKRQNTEMLENGTLDSVIQSHNATLQEGAMQSYQEIMGKPQLRYLIIFI